MGSRAPVAGSRGPYLTRTTASIYCRVRSVTDRSGRTCGASSGDAARRCVLCQTPRSISTMRRRRSPRHWTVEQCQTNVRGVERRVLPAQDSASNAGLRCRSRKRNRPLRQHRRWLVRRRQSRICGRQTRHHGQAGPCPRAIAAPTTCRRAFPSRLLGGYSSLPSSD